jgi:hypothetical protein
MTPVGAAGYVAIVETKRSTGIEGGLLVVNGDGEPLAFCRNRGTFGRTALWQGKFGRRHLLRALVRSLQDASSVQPDVLLFSADSEWSPNDLDLTLPLGVIRAGRVNWVTDRPGEETPAAAVLEALQRHNLLTEPVDRCREALRQTGLRE